MFTVGLTGGIGSGKTTVSTYFSELGITVVDADLIAREVVSPGSECYRAIVERHGAAILLPDNSLNRAALRKIVFANSSERNWLESITHPAIRAEIYARLDDSSSAYTILSAALLLETGQYKVNRVLVVDIPEQEQLSRAASRDNSDAEIIRQIMRSQLGRAKRLERADDVIDNSQAQSHTRQQVETLHTMYLKLANEY